MPLPSLCQKFLWCRLSLFAACWSSPSWAAAMHLLWSTQRVWLLSKSKIETQKRIVFLSLLYLIQSANLSQQVFPMLYSTLCVTPVPHISSNWITVTWRPLRVIPVMLRLIWSPKCTHTFWMRTERSTPRNLNVLSTLTRICAIPDRPSRSLKLQVSTWQPLWNNSNAPQNWQAH